MAVQVTSVSRRPEPLAEAPSAIQVITQTDIRRSGATSIPEALRLANNLHVAQRGPKDWAISARGFNTELSNKLLVLMDGRTVYTPLFSGVYWDAQDYILEDIEKIEVISGPGGTLWGANAVNGVINITTKNAADTQGLFTEAAFGEELEALASVRYGGALAPHIHYRIYGTFNERDDGVLANGAEANNGGRHAQAGFRIDATPESLHRFTFQGDLYDGYTRLAAGGAADITGGNLLTRWSYTPSEDSDYSLHLYYDHTRRRQTVPAGIYGPVDTFTDRLDTYDIDFQHRWRPHPRHQLVWGLGYRLLHNAATNAASLGFSPSSVDQHLASAFIEDEIALTDRWSVTLGTKIEHNDYTGWEFEPGARLQWRLKPDHTLWSSVSRAVRMPSRVDTDLRRPVAPLVIFGGNPDFDSETVIAYELGYRARLHPRVVVSAAAFYNRYENIRSLRATPATIIPLVFDNDIEGSTHGLELRATWHPHDNWRLHAGYTFLHQDLRIRAGGTDLNNALNEIADPRHQFSLRSSFDLPGGGGRDAGRRGVDSFQLNNAGTPATVPDYWELDVRLAWRPDDRLELSLVGQNLLNDRHAEYGLPGPSRPEVERAVHAKVTWRY